MNKQLKSISTSIISLIFLSMVATFCDGDKKSTMKATTTTKAVDHIDHNATEAMTLTTHEIMEKVGPTFGAFSAAVKAKEKDKVAAKADELIKLLSMNKALKPPKGDQANWIAYSESIIKTITDIAASALQDTFEGAEEKLGTIGDTIKKAHGEFQ